MNHLGRWDNTICKLVENQYVFTDPISNEFIKIILNTNDVDKEVEKYYSEDDCKQLYSLIERCKKQLQDSNNFELFCQSIGAYQNNYYQIACLGMFTVTDGIISDVSQQDISSFKKRLNKIKDEFDETASLEPLDQKIWCVLKALEKIDISIFADSDFRSNEPDCVNRHWTLHGRSTRKFLFTDVIKVLLWIDALLFIENFNASEEDKEEEK